MKKSLTMVLVILMILTFSVSGCGKNSGQPDAPAITEDQMDTPVNTQDQADTTDIISADTDADNVSNDKKTITMSLCWDFYYVDEAAEKFKRLHPEFEIKITKYSNDYEKYNAQVSTALMAGNSDDLLDGTGIKFKDSATVNLLADFYPLMNADPEYSTNDYFTNVFKALEYKGGLFTFPASFSYECIAVNNQLSDELIGKFAQYDKINSFDLIDLYKDASTGVMEGYYIHNGFDVLTAFVNVKNSFIDMENKTCDFNNQRFIDYLNNAKKATEPEKQFGYTYSSNVYPPAEEATLGKKYLFQPLSADVYQYFLDFEENLVFENPIPFTNEKDQLIISPLKNFCISSQSDNKELAWEFIKYMSSVDEENEDFVFIPSIPVNKDLFRYKYRMDIPGWVDNFKSENNWHIKGDADTQTENVITAVDRINNMPMYYDEFTAYEIVAEVLERFNNGAMTAEQAASELQNRVSLLLME